MKIFGKSKLNSDIYDKINKGADAIEIHLDEDFLNSKEYWNQKIIDDVPIAVIHAPLVKQNNTNIEDVASRSVLVKTCEFANKIAMAQRHNVIVVCHLATNPQLLKKLGVYENLVFFMRDLADIYTELEFAIENVTMFRGDVDEYVGFQNIDFNGPIMLVNDICHPRVGTCLDICHAFVDIGLINYITGYMRKTGEIYNDEISRGLEAFFEKNKQTIKLIHLSNARSHGLYDDHGLPFVSHDNDKLAQILSLYYKYEYNCPITIEVREKDYADAKGFATTYRYLIEQIDGFAHEIV